MLGAAFVFLMNAAPFAKVMTISVCTFGILWKPSFLNSFLLFKEFADTPKG